MTYLLDELVYSESPSPEALRRFGALDPSFTLTFSLSGSLLLLLLRRTLAFLLASAAAFPPLRFPSLTFISFCGQTEIVFVRGRDADGRFL